MWVNNVNWGDKKKTSLQYEVLLVYWKVFSMSQTESMFKS